MQLVAERPMRDAERIGRIHTPVHANMRALLHTASLRRVVRKDFNIVTTKMYLARSATVVKLSSALRSLERACVEAELAAEKWRADYGVQFPGEVFELRIVSPYAHRYARSLVRLDAVNYLLLQGETRGAVARKDRHTIVRPCVALIHEVKCIALNIPRPGENASSDEAN